ncbi:Ribosomal-protein-alanine acetyltransferase [Mycena chlorophos]|uniref:Ribosomal-protein-alanine acetyltransferase n=1 Tax=Mycena chlorophos TaxID=658473 RepID=A0A8H6S8D7_MYCCL|nr:Ribosomal-protein-alanine acetyltransferase [Mycena chlorophos]
MFLDHSIPSKSGRLSLVPPVESDDPAVAVVRSHRLTRQYLRFFPESVSVADATARRLSRQADHSLVDFHIHTSDGEFVGTTGIFGIDNEMRFCEVGILIAPERARGGLATDALFTVLQYAFETRGMHRAEFHTDAENTPMRGWLDTAGATLEGTRRSVWPDHSTGGWSDACIYAILEHEWKSVVKGRLEQRIFAKST